MKKWFHAGLLLLIVSSTLYAVVNHDGARPEKCTREWTHTTSDELI